MTTAEKLRAMEVLWADLSRNEENIQSPSWHGHVLEEREARVKSGQDKFIDWEAAKQELRDRLTWRSSSCLQREVNTSASTVWFTRSNSHYGQSRGKTSGFYAQALG
jgi:hypothetical protein